VTLSILCITNNQHAQVTWFVCQLQRLATTLGAELVLGLDRERAQRAKFRSLATVALELNADQLQEDVMDQAVDACSGAWVLRLDDDEQASPALIHWLQTGAYEQINAPVYAFPRVYLWPDAQHLLSNAGMYPDLQTRLGRKACMYGVNYVHAGNRHGTGQVVPYAIEHHNLLVKSEAERRAILDRYERLRPGAGTRPEYARYNVPEMFYTALETKPYRDGDYSA
jgi:hypothetical protein